MMPAMFTCGRTAGWCAHILEQKRLGKLVRPAAIYVGPEPRSPESVEGWDQISHVVTGGTVTTFAVGGARRSPTWSAPSPNPPGTGRVSASGTCAPSSATRRAR